MELIGCTLLIYGRLDFNFGDKKNLNQNKLKIEETLATINGETYLEKKIIMAKTSTIHFLFYDYPLLCR